ncbi:MAG: Crp/Fnr family transcriptional regulator, partial [Alcaligenaceae bacterium]
MPLSLHRSEVVSNGLLLRLSGDDLDRWLPHLESQDLAVGAVLYAAGEPMHHIYFPSTVIVSMMYAMENGSSAEIAVVGSEGVIGLSFLLGGGSTLSSAVVQSAGRAFRIRADVIREEIRSPAVLPLLLRYILALFTQMSQTAVCNRYHVVDQQLCRWLLLTLDRLDGNAIVMTQELIAGMLGVRREAVAEAASKLQKAGLIRYTRGRIEVIDRPGLEKRFCECYAVVKREYD